ncbi:MAG: hypothetical protein ACOX6U_08675 [Oscillospiraceae bacterium]
MFPFYCTATVKFPQNIIIPHIACSGNILQNIALQWAKQHSSGCRNQLSWPERRQSAACMLQMDTHIGSANVQPGNIRSRLETGAKSGNGDIKNHLSLLYHKEVHFSSIVKPSVQGVC